MATPRLHVIQPIPAPVSSGGNTIRAANLGELVYVDDQGNVASSLSNTAFIILQNANGLLWNLSFNLYNKTHDKIGPHERGFGVVYIQFLDVNGMYVGGHTYEAHFNRTGCRNLGPQTIGGTIAHDIFREGAVTFEMTQKTITADIDPC